MDRIAGIHLFIRVIETGSFSKASRGLGITQPTATKHVAQLEARLGARLFHRSTRGVTPTEVGSAYYDKCKAIAHELEDADNLAALMQSRVAGTLRISTSVAFGRRVLTPLVLQFMRQHPGLAIDLNFEDRYVNLVEQGIDMALRMGRLADSQLGARYLGQNPWVLVAAPGYLKTHGVPKKPADLARHAALIYSTAQGDERWHFTGAAGNASAVAGDGSIAGASAQDARSVTVAVKGPLRSNNLTALLAAASDGLGIAALPCYVAHGALQSGALVALLPLWALPEQEMHAVFPSPKLVPSKVRGFCDFLAQRFGPRWWASSGP